MGIQGDKMTKFSVSHEAEQSVLAILLQNPEMFHSLSDFAPEYFFNSGNQQTAQAIKELVAAGVIPDVMGVYKVSEQEFKDNFGLPFLNKFLDIPVVMTNLDHWYRELKKAALERNEQMQVESHSRRLSQGEYKDTEMLINYHQARAAYLTTESEQGESDDGYLDELTKEWLDDLEAGMQEDAREDYISTGFRDVDEAMEGGFYPQTINLIAARPAMGKTAFALNLASQMIERTQVAFFSLEMPRKKLISRIMSSKAKVYSSKYNRPKKMNDIDYEDTMRTVQEMANILPNMVINDKPNASLEYIESKIRKYKREKDIKVVFIDYLQLIEPPKQKNLGTRELEVSAIAKRLRGLARELDLSMVLLAQLNRALEQRPDKRPRPSDLRESGSLEQEADVIQFLYRDEVYNPETLDKGIAEVITGKNRSGSIGTTKMIFDPQFTLFKDMPKDIY